MLLLLAPKFKRLSHEREEDSTTTLQVVELVAATFIFTDSSEWRDPCSMTRFNNKQLVIRLHTTELSVLPEQILYRRISCTGIM